MTLDCDVINREKIVGTVPAILTWTAGLPLPLGDVVRSTAMPVDTALNAAIRVAAWVIAAMPSPLSTDEL